MDYSRVRLDRHKIDPEKEKEKAGDSQEDSSGTKSTVVEEEPNVRVSRGKVTLENDAVYEGEWLNGQRDGQGSQLWCDGSRYEGTWVQGRASGKGKLYHADGDVYEGEWINDKANGHGSYTHSNGAKYIGEWLDDK